jgi:hypothetical protein
MIVILATIRGMVSAIRPMVSLICASLSRMRRTVSAGNSILTGVDGSLSEMRGTLTGLDRTLMLSP